MKKTFVVISFLLLVLSLLSGCNKNKVEYASPISNPEKMAPYTIVSDESGHYMVFTYPCDFSDYVVPKYQLFELPYSSLDELMGKIERHDFEFTEIIRIRYYLASDKNKSIVKIFDPEHIWEPKMPEGFSWDAVHWCGQNYFYPMIDEKGQAVTLWYFTPEQYSDLWYVKNYETFFEQEAVTLIGQEFDEERNAEVFLYNNRRTPFKKIRYTLPSGVLVDETYALETSENSSSTTSTSNIVPQKSNIVPQKIELYYSSETFCFYTSIWFLTERPSVEWLSQFGLVERQSN